MKQQLLWWRTVTIETNNIHYGYVNKMLLFSEMLWGVFFFFRNEIFAVLLVATSTLNSCSNSVSYVLKYSAGIKAQVNIEAVDSVCNGIRQKHPVYCVISPLKVVLCCRFQNTPPLLQLFQLSSFNIYFIG